MSRCFLKVSVSFGFVLCRVPSLPSFPCLPFLAFLSLPSFPFLPFFPSFLSYLSFLASLPAFPSFPTFPSFHPSFLSVLLCSVLCFSFPCSFFSNFFVSELFGATHHPLASPRPLRTNYVPSRLAVKGNQPKKEHKPEYYQTMPM